MGGLYSVTGVSRELIFFLRNRPLASRALHRFLKMKPLSSFLPMVIKKGSARQTVMRMTLPMSFHRQQKRRRRRKKNLKITMN